MVKCRTTRRSIDLNGQLMHLVVHAPVDIELRRVQFILHRIPPQEVDMHKCSLKMGRLPNDIAISRHYTLSSFELRLWCLRIIPFHLQVFSFNFEAVNLE